MSETQQELPILLKKVVIGEVFLPKEKKIDGFEHRHSHDFYSSILAPAKNTYIEINLLEAPILSIIVLKDLMSDMAITMMSPSSVLRESQLWMLLYVLTIERSLGRRYLGYEFLKYKTYIFHVQFSSGRLVSVDVRLEGNVFFYDTAPYDRGGQWVADNTIFLSLN